MGVSTVIKDYGTEILNCIRENNLQRLKVILEKHLKSDQKIAKLCTTDIKHRPTKKFACPLILASRQEDPRIIKYMMDKGVDPNFVHHTVFSSKRREIVTALHIAVDLAFYDTVAVLLNANADCNITDHNMETPLHIAIKKADRVMSRMLLSKGADPSLPDRRGNAALHIVTLYGHLQLARLLLKYDADVYQKGQWEAIPPHIAAKEGHIHLIQLFCNHDTGNINVKIPCYIDKHEKAPIHLAAENGHVETVLALLDQFLAEVNLKDSEGNTPLHCCVLNPYDPHRMRDKDHFNETARVLIKFCVAINEKNLYGDTALHLAAMNHFQRIVELLLEVGANPFVENDEHLKPLDVVPDSDPVTKQVLKMAMLQPRPTGDSISMASDTLRKELGDFTPNQTPNVVKKPRIEGAMNHSNDSSTAESGGAAPKAVDRNSAISSNSIGSSVFEDMKPPNIPLPPAPPTPTQLGRDETAVKTMTSTPATPSSKHKAEGGTEMMYTKVEKKAKRAAKQKKALERMLGEKSKSTKQGQFQFDADDTLSTLGDTSISSIATEDAVAMTMNNELENVFRKRQQQKQHAPVVGTTEPAFAAEEQYMEMASSPPPQQSTGKSKKQKKKKKRSVDEQPEMETASGDKQAIYANFEQIEALRKEREAAAEKSASGSTTGEPRPGQIIQVQSVEDLGKDGDIQVHAIPGKPGLIEVQYMGGPITIAVNTQEDGTDPEAIADNEGDRQPVSKDQPRGSENPTEPSAQETTPGQVGTGQQPVTIQNGQVVGQGQSTAQPGQLVLGPIGQQKPVVGMTTHGDPIHLLPGQMVAGQASYIVQGQVGHIVQGQFIPYPPDVQAYLLQQHQLMATVPQGVNQERVLTGQNTGVNQLLNGSLSGVSDTQISPAKEQEPKGAASMQQEQPEDNEIETGGDAKLSEQLKQQQMLYEQRLQEQQRQIEQQQLLLLQQKENQELLQQQQKQQEEYVQLIEKQQQLMQQQQKQELLQQKMQVHEGQQKKQTQEQKMTAQEEPYQKQEEPHQKQEVPQQKVKVEEGQDQKQKQELLQQKMQVHEPQQKQQPPHAMYYLRSDGSLNEDEEYEVSPDVSPNASPHYKNFQQAMAWAKSLENKTVSPGRVTDKQEMPPQSVGKSTQFETPGKQAGILATPQKGHWKVAPGSAMTVVEAIGEDGDIGEMKGTDFKKALQHPQNKHNDFYSITPGDESKKREAVRSTGIQDVVTEYDQEPGVLQKCTLSAPGTDSDLSPTSPTNVSERSSSPQSVYSEGGTRYSGLNMHVTGQAPKAYSRAATASARKAFMLAKPIGIESGSEASDTELGGSRSSLSTGRQWAETTKPVYGKSGPEGLVGRKTGKEPESGEKETPKPETGDKKSKDGYKMIGSYAKPYKSFGPIETKTDVIDEVMAEQMESDEALDEVFQANLRHSQEFDREMVLAALAGTTVEEKKAKLAQQARGTEDEPKYCMIPEEMNSSKDEDTEAGERISSKPLSQAGGKVAAPVTDNLPSSPAVSPKTVTFKDQPQDGVMTVGMTTVVTTVTTAGPATQMTMADIVITGENDDDDDESLERYEDEPHMIKPRKVVGMPTALAAVTKQALGKTGTESPSRIQGGSLAPGEPEASQQPIGGQRVAPSEPERVAEQQQRQPQRQGHPPAQVQTGVLQLPVGQYADQQLTTEQQQLMQQQQQLQQQQHPEYASQQGAWNQYAGTDDPMFAMQQQLINQQQQQMTQQQQQLPQQHQQQQQTTQQQPQQQVAIEDEEVAKISAAAAKKKKGKSKKTKKGKKKKADKVVAIEPVVPGQETPGQQPQVGEPQFQQGQPQYMQGQEAQYQQEQPQYQQGQPQYQQGQEPQYLHGQMPQYQQGQEPQYQQGQQQYEQGQEPQHQQGQEPQYQQGQPQYQQGQEPRYQQGQPQYQQGQEPQYQQEQEPQYQQGIPQYHQGQPQYQQGQEVQHQQGQPQHQRRHEPQYQQGQEPQYQQGQEPQYQQGQEPQYKQGQPQYQQEQPQYQQGQPQYQQGQYQQGEEPQYQPGQEGQYPSAGQGSQIYQQVTERQYPPDVDMQYEHGGAPQYPQAGQQYQQGEPQYNQGRDPQYQQPDDDPRPQAVDQDASMDAQSPIPAGHDLSFDSQNKAKKKGGFWSFPSGRRKKGKGSTSELPKSQSNDGNIREASYPPNEEEGDPGDGNQDEVKRKGSFFNLASMRSKKKGKKSKHAETYGATPYIEGEGQVQLDADQQHAEWSHSVAARGQQVTRETDIDADLEVQQPYEQQQQPYQQPYEKQPYEQPYEQQPHKQQQQIYEQQQQPYQQPYDQRQPYQQQHPHQQQPYEQQQPYDQQQPHQQQQKQQLDQQPGVLPAGPLGILYPSDAQDVTQQWLQRSPRRARKPKPSGAAIAIEPVVVPATFEDAALASITANLQNRHTNDDATGSEEPIPQEQEPMSRMWKGQGERDMEMQQVLESTQGGDQPYDLNQEPLPPDSDHRQTEQVRLRRPVGSKPAWEKRGDTKRRSYRESETDPKSDTELMWRPHDTQLSDQAEDMHSEADMQESDQPTVPHDPAKPLTQVAIEALESGQHDHRVISKPPRPVKSQALGVYRPKPQYWKRGSGGGDGSYNDSQLSWSGRRSMTTESEGEADTEEIVFYNDIAQTPQGAAPSGGFTSTPEDGENKETALAVSAFQPVSPGSQKRVTIVDQRGRRRKRRRDLAPRVTEPGPVDFSQYGVTARLWMEQVDKKTVQKSKTMYLSVMPENHDPPPALAHSISYESTNDDVFLPPQWVIARGRSIRHKKRKFDEQQKRISATGATSGESDGEMSSGQPERPLSPGRQVLLFFRVGSNWKDLAWVLFDGVQSDAETIRMIKDIQLKQPGKLTEQVHDLMHRWWTKKGIIATVEELKKALDFINMAYIHEEYFDNMRKALTSYTGSEGDLDISEISDDDPDVSRLIQEYNVRSLNTSYDYDSAAEASRYSMSTETIMRKLNKRGLIMRRGKFDSSRDSAGRTQSNSSRLNSSRESIDYTSDQGEHRRSFVIVQPQLKPGDYRHETNL